MTGRPKKALHIFNNAGGGSALSTLGLIETLRNDGIGACAVCHTSGTREERERLRDAVNGDVLFTRLYWWNRKIRMPLWRRPLAEAKQLLITGWSMRSTGRVCEFAARLGADLIHTNTLLTPEGGLAARRLGLPHVWHLRELLGPGNPFRLRREGPALGRYMARYCSKLVANSKTSAAIVRAWLPEDILEVVPNGIDISRFRIEPTPRQAGRVVVGMVGNLTSHTKKHALFIDAAALVDRALPIRWRIYGHDPSEAGRISGNAYLDELHARIARAGLTDRFDWPGFVAEPAEIMSEIDMLVHPADNESFGRAIVEAMAAALPVVGVRGGGVGDIVEENVTGVLAEKDQPHDLAARIEELVRDPQRRDALGRAGRQRAETDYSLAACASGMLRVYEQAMARPVGRANPGRLPAVDAAH